MNAISIEQLESQVALHRGRYKTAEALLRAAMAAECPVRISDIVLSTRHADAEFRVTSVDARWRGIFWLTGVTRLKNGKWGTLERKLYDDWRLP